MNKIRTYLVSALAAVLVAASLGVGVVIIGTAIVFGMLITLMAWIAPKLAEAKTDFVMPNSSYEPKPE
jgi:hypothetical protein